MMWSVLAILKPTNAKPLITLSRFLSLVSFLSHLPVILFSVQPGTCRSLVHKGLCNVLY
eukprot:m.138478 g.138478  ORF g.138478 m.138478 type:complete len:59 (-) comp14001_c0_seq12:298-474(-)